MNSNQMPPLVSSQSHSPTPPSTWLVIGASRGIGLEFTRQLLAKGNQVIATVRDVSSASEIWRLAAGGSSPAPSPASSQLHLSPQQARPGSCIIEQCDVTSELDINAFISRMARLVERGGRIENMVLNAGVLRYEQGLGATDVSMQEFMFHLQTNCVGPIIIAQKLLQLNELLHSPTLGATDRATSWKDVLVGRKVIFISSDSGSMIDFRHFEDGFASYAASKSALNMMIRHMAVELKKRGEATKSFSEDKQHTWASQVCVLAMHPGEVQTDMANIDVAWEVEGIISPEESVRDMLRVISTKNERHSGTFWCWDGREHPW